ERSSELRPAEPRLANGSMLGAARRVNVVPRIARAPIQLLTACQLRPDGAADLTRGDGPYAVLAIGLASGLPRVGPIWAIARVPLSNLPRPRDLSADRGPRVSSALRASRPALAPP